MKWHYSIKQGLNGAITKHLEWLRNHHNYTWEQLWNNKYTQPYLQRRLWP